MGDPEVHVVDDAREVVRGRPVLAEQRDPIEALAELGAGLAVTVLSLTLPDGPFLPSQAEPFEVAHDLPLPTWHVPLRIGVVDPQEHPVAQPAVGDRADDVTDAWGPGGARCEADSF